MTWRRRLSVPALGHAPVLVAAAVAGFGFGPPDVTAAVWLDGVNPCGGSLLPAFGRETVMMAPMVGLMLVGHGLGPGGTRSWRVAVARIGLMALLHLAVMMCDDLSRHAGSVALGRDLRAAVLAGLVVASWLCRARFHTPSIACALRCGSVMTTLMLTASLPWSVAGVAPLAVLIARFAPDVPLRERWTSAFGLAGAIAVAGWG